MSDACALRVVTSVSIQDRDGARLVTRLAKQRHGNIALIWADAGYRGRFIEWARTQLAVIVEVVTKREGQQGFEVSPDAGASNGPSRGSPNADAPTPPSNDSHATPKP